MGAGKRLETEQSGICLGFGKGNWWVGEWQSEETGVCQHEIRNELSGCLLLGGNNKTEMLRAASRQLGVVKTRPGGEVWGTWRQKVRDQLTRGRMQRKVRHQL